MGKKLETLSEDCDLYKDGHREYFFYCDGCKYDHRYVTTWGKKAKEDHAKHFGYAPTWTFNDDLEKPTFSPSLLMKGVQHITDDEHKRIMNGEKIDPKPKICHLFVTDGKIQYLNDCTHHLAGQTIEMKDVDL